MDDEKEFKPHQHVKVVAGEWLVGETGVIETMDNNIFGIHVKFDQLREGMPANGRGSFMGKELELIDDAASSADPREAEIERLQAQVDRLTKALNLINNLVLIYVVPEMFAVRVKQLIRDALHPAESPIQE